MRKTRVHVNTELSVGTEIVLPEAQAHYLKNVLRLKPGAALLLFNGKQPSDFHATLIANGKKLSASIESATAVATESKLQIELIQGLGRADHMDWMIQKTTELGVDRIALFNAERTQSPLKSVKLEKKMQHWRSVAISACEQSGRALIPELLFHPDMEQAIAASNSECRLLLDFEGIPLQAALKSTPGSIGIILGPEGGLNSSEIHQAQQAGFTNVCLGPRVLRTETAAISAVAIAQALVGDLK